MQDEDQQTREVFDALTGQQMASAPPRVSDRPAQTEMTLESVPGFDRPMSSSPDDRIVGQDELGRRIYETITGQRYTVSRNPDQRTTRTRVQEAVSEFAENPRLPTAREAVGFAGDVVQGAYESAAGAVRGTGTIGDVAGMAVGSGAGSMFGEVPEGALRSFGGATSGRVTNPLLTNRNLGDAPGVQTNPDLTFVASFYSPLRSAVEQMPIAREGSTGRNIMAYLQKRAPNVTSSELNFSRLNLDPEKRYTRDEVLSAIEFDTENVLANLTEVRSRNSSLTSNVNTAQSSRFSGEQAQNVTDRQEAYIEITLDSDRLPKELVPGFTTHHGETTLAHTRGSINTDENGQYILVWEFQSDPLQNLGRTYNQNDNTGYGGPEAFSGIWVEENLRDLRDGAFGRETQATPNEGLLLDVINKSFSSDLDREGLKAFYRDEYGIEVSGNSTEGLHRSAIRQTTRDIDQAFEDYLDELFDELEYQVTDYKKGETSLTETEVPFSTNTQYVRNLIVSLAARARMDGIDRIVIPPIEEIARQRVGTGSFKTMEDAVRALRPTYVDAVRKAVNILNNETQGQIRLGSQELSYPDLTESEGVRRTRGLLLDISNFDFDPQTQAARFAEGGMVDMERQMDLFEEGGLTDDGAMRDPVSGNEVPSGSMATEVRDDVPAMLSEGEYIVPADVVRFFGVKFFEDLRSQAKSGLQGMEQDGRIGGDPVGMNQDDLTAEELQMLAELSGMYTGGMVQKGYQEGGMVSANYTVPGASLFGATAGGITSVTLYGPNCETTSVTLPTDQQAYNTLLAQGYSTTQPAHCRTPNQQQQFQGTPGRGRQEGEGGEPFSFSPSGGSTTPRAMNQDEFNAMNENPTAYGLEALEGRDYTRVGAGVGTMVAGMPGMLIGGGLGVANQLSRLSNANAALEIARARGEDTTELEAAIEGFVDDLPNAARIALELGAASGSRIVERFNRTLEQLDPATATGVTTPTVTATPLPSTPAASIPQTPPTGVQTTGEIDTDYQGEQVTGDRTLSPRDVEILTEAGRVEAGSVEPGATATKEEQDFLEARETQVRSFMGPDTAQTRADRASAMRPAFPTAEPGRAIQETPGGIRDGNGNYLVETPDGDLRPARPGEVIRDFETGDMVTVPETLPPAPQVPTQAPTSAQAGLRGGQLNAPRPFVDTPQIEFGTIRPTVSRVPTIPPMPDVAPFASTRTYTPPPLVPNQTQYNPMTGRFEYYDTNYTPTPQTDPQYSWQQPGFTPSQAYQEAFNRLSTGQTPTPSTSLSGLRGEDLLPPTTSTVTREKGQTSIVSRPTKDDGGTTFSPSRSSTSKTTKTTTSRDDGGTNFSPSKPSSSSASSPKDDGGTNFSSSSTKSTASSSEPTSRQQAEQAAKDLGVGLATGGRNKGGLVSRPKKKKVAKKK